jgi:hypothetical protein
MIGEVHSMFDRKRASLLEYRNNEINSISFQKEIDCLSIVVTRDNASKKDYQVQPHTDGVCQCNAVFTMVLKDQSLFI